MGTRSRVVSVTNVWGKAEYSFSLPGCVMDSAVREACFPTEGLPVTGWGNGNAPLAPALSTWCRDWLVLIALQKACSHLLAGQSIMQTTYRIR